MEEHVQMNLFEASYEKPKHLPTHIRLIEFFAGIGAQAKALEILGADFEHWRTCEWSWQSITAYNAIHMGGEVVDTSELTYGDVLREIEGQKNTLVFRCKLIIARLHFQLADLIIHKG